MPSWNSNVTGESWRTFFTVVIGTWMAVWFCAALHNQYLIRIAPEHFTVRHYRMPYFTSYTALGIAYAFGASASPGVVLGMLLYIAGRLFSRPKLSPRQIVLPVLWVWLAVEICAGAVGFIVWRSGRGVYPDWIYPDESIGLLVTQSIQITAYLSGAFFSVVLIFLTWHRRKYLSR